MGGEWETRNIHYTSLMCADIMRTILLFLETNIIGNFLETDFTIVD